MWDIVVLVLMWVAVAAAAFLVWVFIELALTIRKTRSTVADLKERIEPTLAHVEQITSSLEPAIARIDPLIERVQLTVDTVNLELMQIDKILSDASDMTGTANSAVKKISNATSVPSKIFNGAAAKLRSSFGKKVSGKHVADTLSEARVNSLGTPEADSNEVQASTESVEAVRDWVQSVSGKSEEDVDTADTSSSDEEADAFRLDELDYFTFPDISDEIR